MGGMNFLQSVPFNNRKEVYVAKYVGMWALQYPVHVLTRCFEQNSKGKVRILINDIGDDDIIIWLISCKRRTEFIVEHYMLNAGDP